MIDIRSDHAGQQQVDVVTLTEGSLRAVVTNLGAKLLELQVPDAHGSTADVVLQRPTLAEIATDENYFGATAGRFANRIREGRLTIDGQAFELSINEGRNHLHGGRVGFDRHVWTTEPGGNASVAFRRTSPDGEEGYPGALACKVTYRLEPSALIIDIEATTDAPTVCNLVHHSYFNLGGHDSGSILDSLLELHSSYYLPVDEELLPTGEVLAVAGTPFDFRNPTPIGRHVAEVQHGGAGRATTDAGAGFDHNWVLEGVGMRQVLTLTDPASGRKMIMSTNQPGVQVYTGGYLDGVSAKGAVGRYAAFSGVTMETQTFPDAVNFSHFPQALLRPGQTYENRMRFDFSTTAS